MLMEFFMPPGGDEDAPFVGRLQAMPEASAPARNPSYRTVYARAPATKAQTRDYLPAQTGNRMIRPQLALTHPEKQAIERQQTKSVSKKEAFGSQEANTRLEAIRQ